MDVLIVFLLFLFLILILGLPMSFSMLISAVISVVFVLQEPLFVVIQRMFVGVDSSPLLAVPYFILAGGLMTSGGISKRLVNLGSALLGHLTGGLAIATVFASTIFDGLSGSSAADTATFCKICGPEMVKKGYEKGFIASLLACSGTNGPIIPPSIIMVIYGSITGISIGKLLLAGFIPGVLISVVLVIISWFYAKKKNIKKEPRKSFKELLKSIADSFWAIIVPVVILGSIGFGIATPTEAGMIAVLLSFIVGFFIYKELKIKDIPAIVYESAYVTFCLMFIAAVASSFAWALAKMKFPVLVVNALTAISTNPSVVIALVILMFLLIGFVCETLSAMIIFVPIVSPLAIQFGFDPIHFALVILVTLMVGQVTPPVGVLLSLGCQVMGIEVSEALRHVVPMVIGLIALLFLLAYVPQLTLFIPHLFMGQ